MDYSRVARKLRKKISAFSGELSMGLPKACRSFVHEMVYGIQASQSVVLTKIARTLEEPVSIKKVEERLSRQLGRKGLDSMIQKNLLKLSSDREKKDTLLILDPSDLRKKYGKEKGYHLEFGFINVKLPGRKEPLCLLVVKGFGQKLMMLLTTEPSRRRRKVPWCLVEAYIRRWTIEETIRFIKQSYDLEDVRVLGYQSLQNLLPLVMAASYFAAVVLDTEAKLKVMAGYVLKAAKRVFGIPDFHYYAIADGITSIFQRYPRRIPVIVPKISNQMVLFEQGS